MKTRQVGISPKAILAAVLPTLGGLIAVGVQWAVTGTFDKAELATALTAVGAALVSFLGAWAASPGNVIHDPPASMPVDQLGGTPPGEPGPITRRTP